MRSGQAVYHPTLWRTCRALMNERRLACLSVVLANPGLSVGEIARMAEIPENQASINLRALQARGLLAARRDGRWIRYDAEADPLVEHAAAVLQALRLEWRRCGDTGQVMETLRAFTHSRRLTLLGFLVRKGGATHEEIAAGTRISRQAVGRHLETLRRTGLVVPTKGGVWKVMARRRLSGLKRDLLDVVENRCPHAHFS